MATFDVLPKPLDLTWRRNQSAKGLWVLMIDCREQFMRQQEGQLWVAPAQNFVPHWHMERRRLWQPRLRELSKNVPGHVPPALAFGSHGCQCISHAPLCIALIISLGEIADRMHLLGCERTPSELCCHIRIVMELI